MSKKFTIQEKYNQLRTLWLDSTDVVESTIYLLELKKMKDEYPDFIQLERVPFGHPDSG